MIRPLSDDDYPGLTRLWRKLRPDAVHSERALRHLVETFPPRSEDRHWVADEDGVVGWVFAHRRWWRASNTGYIWAGVLPEARRRGIGSELWRLGEEHIASLGVERVYSHVVADEAGERLLAGRGFSPDKTDVISAVDPRAVDLGDLDERQRRAEAGGYRTSTYGEVDPCKLYELHIQTSNDMPGGDAPHELSFDEWRHELLEQPDMTLEGSIAIVAGDEPVAHSALSVDLAGHLARNEGTGTARAHRRRGLATLAKLAQMRWAAEQGIERIITDNEETNAGMLAINRRLGYVPFVERRGWVKAATETAFSREQAAPAP